MHFLYQVAYWKMKKFLIYQSFLQWKKMNGNKSSLSVQIIEYSSIHTHYFPFILLKYKQKSVMSKSFTDQKQQEYAQVLKSEDEKPFPVKDIYSSGNSFSTKSKFLRQQDNRSMSYNSTFKETPYSHRRKQQNKESAKRSRIRRKQRFQELEYKEKQLQEQLFILQTKNSKTKLQLEKYISKCNILNIFNNIGRTQTYNRLQKLTQSQGVVDEDEINMIIDNLRNKVGVKGAERQGKINYIFKQIIQICFPALYRYFMWAAQNEIHYFGDLQKQSGWLGSLDQILDLTEDQKEAIRSKKDNWRKHFQIFSEMIDDMKRTKDEFQKQSNILEKGLDDLRFIVNPVQCGKIVTFIESNKYKQEMDLWVKRNIRKFTSQPVSAIDPGPVKRTKIQQP